MILAELDATDMRNWANRKWNAFRAAGGNQRALDQHTVRLGTNKLYQGWRQYLQKNRLQGTDQDLSKFISQSFGGDHLQQLRQQFPWLSQEDASFDEPERLPPPDQPAPQDQDELDIQNQPTEPTEQEKKLYVGFQKDISIINQMFAPMAIPPTRDQAINAIVSLIHKYWGQGPKAQGYVSSYLNQLKRNSNVTDVLPNVANLHPAAWGA